MLSSSGSGSFEPLKLLFGVDSEKHATAAGSLDDPENQIEMRPIPQKHHPTSAKGEETKKSDSAEEDSDDEQLEFQLV